MGSRGPPVERALDWLFPLPWPADGPNRWAGGACGARRFPRPLTPTPGLTAEPPGAYRPGARASPARSAVARSRRAGRKALRPLSRTHAHKEPADDARG